MRNDELPFNDVICTHSSTAGNLHVAAWNRNQKITSFLIEIGANVNGKVRNGNNEVPSLLANAGASLLLENAGNQLCKAVAGSVLLLKAGASVLSVARWGKTPLDEARLGENKALITFLKDAQRNHLSEFSVSFERNEAYQVSTGRTKQKQCTVFLYNPWDNSHSSWHSTTSLPPFNPTDKRTPLTYLDSQGKMHRISKHAPDHVLHC